MAGLGQIKRLVLVGQAVGLRPAASGSVLSTGESRRTNLTLVGKCNPLYDPWLSLFKAHDPEKEPNKITHRDRTNWDKFYEKPAPWDYKNKKYTLLNEFTGTDITKLRFDNNTKYVAVEGLPGAGKGEFIKNFAKEFPFKVSEDIDLGRDLYTNSMTGFDFQSIDDLLPPSEQALDVDRWVHEPHHPAANWMQYWLYYMRYMHTVDDLAHIFSTGEGIIRERCVWSESAWDNAMMKHGYCTRDCKCSSHSLLLVLIYHRVSFNSPQLHG